jgi:hypothetical protein
MPPVKRLNGLAVAGSRATRVDCWTGSDYARVIVSGSMPDHDIPALTADTPICIDEVLCPPNKPLLERG